VAATANVEIQERRAKEDLRAAALSYCFALQRLLQVTTRWRRWAGHPGLPAAMRAASGSCGV
jgi:hypothetical protein